MTNRPVHGGGAGRRLTALLGLAALILGVTLLGAVVGDLTRDSGAPQLVRQLDAETNDAVVTLPPRPRRAERVAIPVRIEIPSIGVRAPIIRLGLNPDRTLEVPKDFGDTGWWSGGPRPGEPGPAVIAGHVDSYTGPAVFFRLRELRSRDEIVVVRRDGTRAHFTVQGSEQYPKSDFPTTRVYGRTSGPTLRLVTCGGTFDRSSGHYLDNTVVYARAT
jgi:sortase (surface protein transpeptidase)